MADEGEGGGRSRQQDHLGVADAHQEIGEHGEGVGFSILEDAFSERLVQQRLLGDPPRI